MKVQVDVGTSEQRRLIKKELSILKGAARGGGVTERIDKVIVPSDFDNKVRELTGDPLFQANRGYHLVVAKIIESPKDITIVISPVAFTKGFDTQVRTYLYNHEVSHVFHKTRFPPRAEESDAEHADFDNLYMLYDEYAAQRYALESCSRLFNESSDLYVSYHRAACAGFVEALDDDKSYHHLTSAVARFRCRLIDITGYLSEVQPVSDKISKSLIYSAAYIDSGTGFFQDDSISTEARFVTDSAQALVDYFAGKYKADDFDLSNGIDQIKAFLQTFGYVYEDTPEGVYCRVVGLSL